MKMNIGKAVKRLFSRKQSAPKQTVSKSGYVREEKQVKKSRRINFGKSPEYHNNLQARKAKRVRKSRKANKLSRKQRKLNAKGGKR